jgi:hypothetical protein
LSETQKGVDPEFKVQIPVLQKKKKKKETQKEPTCRHINQQKLIIQASKHL